MLQDGSSSANNSTLMEDATVDPVVRGFIRDWDAMEDLLYHVLYTGLGWEEGNEGQILFAGPLLHTPREQLVQLMFETFDISRFECSMLQNKHYSLFMRWSIFQDEVLILAMGKLVNIKAKYYTHKPSFRSGRMILRSQCC